MKLIDFHAHVYPEKIAQKAAEKICAYYDLKEGMTGTSSVLLEQGKKAGIDAYVILPVATKAENVRSINNFALGEQKLHKEFISFGTLHADMNEICSEIDFIKESGLHGVKLHPDQQGFSIDDKRLYEAYDYLQDRLPLVIHCGDKKSLLSHPERLKKVLKDFPRLKLVAAHLGGWSLFNDAVEILKDQDCYFDISSCFYFISPEKMQEYIHIYGAEKILFGSDFPMWNPQKEVERFFNIPLTDEERELIAYKNAERFLDKKIISESF